MGEIGRRMGALLTRAGHTVIGYDIAPVALGRATREGIRPARNLPELCQQSGVVITCVTDGAALRAVATGPGGLEGNLPAGTPVIDTTSAEPWISSQIAERLALRGIPFLDAPVSGGVPAAEAGRMNFMVGGDRGLLEHVRPLLSVLGSTIAHVGPTGSGHTVKAVNMLALASSMLATAELVALGRAIGFKAEEVISALEAGEGASYSTRLHYPRFILPGNFSSGFRFDLMLKDLAIGIELANRLDVPLFLLRSTFEIYRAAKHCGLSGQDNTCITQFRFDASRSDRAGRKIAMQALDRTAAGFNAAIGAEALCLGVAAGLTTTSIIKVLSASSGDSRTLSHGIAAWLAGGETDGPWTVGDLVAAHREALDAALPAGLSLPLLYQSFSMTCAAQKQTAEHTGVGAIVGLVSRWTGCPSVAGAPAGRREGSGL